MVMRTTTRWKRLRCNATLALVLGILVACSGDVGPVGPTGPAGGGNGSVDIAVSVVGTPPIVRADGTTSFALTFRVATFADNNVAGIPVSFSVLSGAGSVSPASATTNMQGEATTTFTAGTQPGEVIVAGSVERAGIAITEAVDLFLDPSTMSAPLLSQEFASPLQPNWSADGQTLTFTTDLYNDYRLYKVSAAGGTPAFVGSYRGGAWNPDGSGDIAAFTAPSGDYNEDDSLFVIDEDGTARGSGLRPAAFYGTMRAVGWCYSDTLLIASNTNALLCVTDRNGNAARTFYLNAWVYSISPAYDTPDVLVQGAGDEIGGLFSLNIMTETTQQIVTGENWYNAQRCLRGGSLRASDGTVVFGAGDPVGDYSYCGSAEHGLYTIPFAGGVEQLLIDSPANETWPAWSPDGSKIAFSSDRSGGGYNIYVYDVGPPARVARGSAGSQ